MTPAFHKVTVSERTAGLLKHELKDLASRFGALTRIAWQFHQGGRCAPGKQIRRLGDGLYKMRLTEALRIPFFFTEGPQGLALHFGDIGSHDAGEVWHRVAPVVEIAEALHVAPSPIAIEFDAPLVSDRPWPVRRVWDPAWDERRRRDPEAGLLLDLDEAQRAIAMRPGPVLLKGGAGSGKTTVALYRLMMGEGQGRQLYVTYTPQLKRHAERLYHCLSPRRDNPPRFMTLDEVCRALLPDDGAFAPEQRLTLSAFKHHLFGRLNRFIGRDPERYWEEIQAVIKGDEQLLAAPERAYLTREAYLESPLRTSDDPDAFYRVFEAYRALDGWDDLDLAQAAYRAVLAGENSLGTFDELVIDEAQDLTAFHLGILMRLCARPDGFFLAGDTHQAIHPGRFDWLRFRERLYRHWRIGLGREAVLQLPTNYRSPEPVVALANKIAAWRGEVLGDPDGAPVAALKSGPAICRLRPSEIGSLPPPERLSARLMVVVSGEAAKEELRDRFGEAPLFTVHEAKGLEREYVVLWNLLDADWAVWERRDPADSRLRYAINRFNVAVTRAIEQLFIVDAFWPRGWEPLADCPLVEGEAALLRLKDILEAADEDATFIAQRAEELAERGHHAQAAALYERIGAWSEAATCYELLSRWADAAVCYEHAERFKQAAACAERGGLWRDAVTYWDMAGDKRRAAQGLLELGAWREALPRLRALGDAAGTARCLERLEVYEEAAEAYEKAGDAAGVARCMGRLGQNETAAQRFEACGAWAQAGVHWERAGKRDRAYAAYCEGQDWLPAGRLMAEAHDWEAALGHFRTAEAPLLAMYAARRKNDKKALLRAAERFAIACSREASAEAKPADELLAFWRALMTEDFAWVWEADWRELVPVAWRIFGEVFAAQAERARRIDWAALDAHVAARHWDEAIALLERAGRVEAVAALRAGSDYST
ncbi:AAA family ATPase [bacterium]|nr:AAA family ATPase [bacterium]